MIKAPKQPPKLPDGIAYATEPEIKQWTIGEFRMMNPGAEVHDIDLQRYPLRIPNWRLLRVSADSELVSDFDGPDKKLQDGLYLVDTKPT